MNIITKENLENNRKDHLDLSEICLIRGGNSTNHRGVLAQYLNTDFPTKIDLCHACGNDKCSNPKHLYWGTRAENVHDMKIHGTFTSPWQRTVEKYGLEEAKRINSLRGKQYGHIGGRNNKGKPKSNVHKQNISRSLKVK